MARSGDKSINSDEEGVGAAPPLAPKVLTPEAERALAEAEARRRQALPLPERPNETGGRPGPDPVRYGDWEKGGIASDF